MVIGIRYLIFVFTCYFSYNISQAQDAYKDYNLFLTKYVNEKGQVNYSKIKQNYTKLNHIVSTLSGLKIKSDWSKNDKLAYWINIYNVLTIKLIVDNLPINSIKDLDNGKTWEIKRFQIDGAMYSLNMIENDIIRPMSKDGRVHFAINCGAVSCPPLLNKAYSGDILESQLESQAKKFINHPGYNTIKIDKLYLSSVFDWYREDFSDVKLFINRYSKIKVKSSATINYLNYDWKLNGR